jgi:hypothetical protein
MHAIIDKKFYLGPKFGTLFIKKWITISELLQFIAHVVRKDIEQGSVSSYGKR